MTASAGRSFLVATEEGILHQMRRAAPDKELIAAPPDENCSCNTCPHMKRNTMEKLYRALESLSPSIDVPEPVRVRAKRPIDRMLEMTAGLALKPAGNRS